MRIASFRVENFKSLLDVTVTLPRFSCLIGLNGSGKSTVLQFFDFLSQQMRGNLDAWLADRSWKASELKSKLTPRKTIEFEITFETDDPDWPGRWHGIFNPQLLRCTTEEIEIGDTRLTVADGKLIIEPHGVSLNLGDEPDRSSISFKYQGSILSQLREDRVGEALMEFRQFIAQIHSFDMLSPHYLRQRTREAAGSLGLGGQRLAAFVHDLDSATRHRLLARLQHAYPHVSDLNVKSLRSGWKQLEVTEDFEGNAASIFSNMTTEARHLNDGMLRLIAIFAELESGHPIVLFDEIENGINPELVRFLIDTLVGSPQQIVVTTHSPMILNYLDDEIAKDAVIYLYKLPSGETKSIPFFSIPSIAEKLAVMGPGEVFADTDLTELGREIESL